MENKEKILAAAASLFARQGLSFTMQDLANELHMAKKTVYKLFPSKEALLQEVLEETFRRIQQEKARLAGSDLPYKEKLRKVMIALPEDIRVLDLRRLQPLAQRYPEVYHSLQHHLRSNWEPVYGLLEEGKRKGEIRDYDPVILRITVSACIESFLSGGELEEAGITYEEALERMMDIIMEGIAV